MAEKVAEDRDVEERVRLIVQELEKEADRRVQRRSSEEERWLEDLRQYHGRYDSDTLARLKRAGRSTVFVNLTRPKTNSLIARLSDMMFPVDDRNWEVEETPVPQLSEQAREAMETARQAREEADLAAQEGGAEAPRIAQAAQAAEDEAVTLQMELDEARKRSRRMERIIDDQLVESHYEAECRDVIEWACKIGTGVLKGPVTDDRTRPVWEQGEDEFRLTRVDDEAPRVHSVDPWGFFPDPDAGSVEDCDGIFERHLLTRKQLRKLAKMPGMRRDAVRELLREGPQRNTPNYWTHLRNILGEDTQSSDMRDRFHVWEYHGIIDDEDSLRALAELAAPQLLEDGVIGGAEVDPLSEVPIVAWFCQGKLLRFGIHSLDSGDPIYSVYNLEKDESSIWGYGIPYIVRDAQAALNGAWRMMLDNAAVSAIPQTVVDDAIIEPVDGDWNITGGKLWRWKSDARTLSNKGNDPFSVYNIPCNQGELAGIIEIARKQIDEETAMPMIAQGEQGTGVTKTAQGMALLLSSSNVVFRRFVRNFDDDVTVPTLRRLYDWNMQFSTDEKAKGDMSVRARGAGVLMVREMQAQNLIVLASTLAVSEPYAAEHDHRALLEQTYRAHMVDASQVLLSDAEKEQRAAQAQDEGPTEEEIKQLELQMKEREWDTRAQIANLESETKKYVAQMDRDTELIKVAEEHNMTLEQLRAKLQIEREKTASKERIFAAEAGAAKQGVPNEAQGGGYL